jgi:hypothetical protein
MDAVPKESIMLRELPAPPTIPSISIPSFRSDIGCITVSAIACPFHFSSAGSPAATQMERTTAIKTRMQMKLITLDAPLSAGGSISEMFQDDGNILHSFSNVRR